MRSIKHIYLIAILLCIANSAISQSLSFAQVSNLNRTQSGFLLSKTPVVKSFCSAATPAGCSASTPISSEKNNNGRNYFNYTIKLVKPTVPLQEVVMLLPKRTAYQTELIEPYRKKAGARLKIAGGLLFGSTALSLVGVLVLSQPRSAPATAPILLGLSVASLLGSGVALVSAGNAMYEKELHD